MMMKPGSLIGALGAAAMLLGADTASAQFFPFFGPPQQQQQRQVPQPQPQARPAPAKKSAPPARRAQEPAQQRAAPKAAAAPKAPPPGTAAVPYPEVRTACHAEIRSTCAGVVPGSAESVQCLRPNFGAHMPPCQEALTRAASVTAPAAAPAEAKPSEPAGTADAPRVVSTDRITRPESMKESAAPDLKLPAMRPTQEARWVNRNCREDHSLLCQGVTFGQSRVLKCLLSHHSSLTNACKNALAKR
ncbi:MAG: hypothetical protein AB7F49_11195 [Pseudorhodoplanes sp.]